MALVLYIPLYIAASGMIWSVRSDRHMACCTRVSLFKRPVPHLSLETTNCKHTAFEPKNSHWDVADQRCRGEAIANFWQGSLRYATLLAFGRAV
jgi:hypothetical protein